MNTRLVVEIYGLISLYSMAFFIVSIFHIARKLFFWFFLNKKTCKALSIPRWYIAATYRRKISLVCRCTTLILTFSISFFLQPTKTDLHELISTLFYFLFAGMYKIANTKYMSKKLVWSSNCKYKYIEALSKIQWRLASLVAYSLRRWWEMISFKKTMRRRGQNAVSFPIVSTVYSFR